MSKFLLVFLLIGCVRAPLPIWYQFIDQCVQECEHGIKTVQIYEKFGMCACKDAPNETP